MPSPPAPPRRQARTFGFWAACLALPWLAACSTVAVQADPTARQPQPEVADLGASADAYQMVTYTPPGWPEAQYGALYAPRTLPPFRLRPAVVVIHGGGWDGRTLWDMKFLSHRLAERGYVVLNVAYRLAPRWRDPAAREDLVQAVGYLRANAERLGIDPDRIGAWGYSAGAHLALKLAQDLRDQGRPGLAAVVAGGAPADFTLYAESPIVRKYMGCELADCRARWLAASPVQGVDARMPPTYLYHGTFDRLVYPVNAEHMEAALAQANVPHELVWVRGLGHPWTFVFGRDAEKWGIEFLDRHLHPGTDAPPASQAGPAPAPGSGRVPAAGRRP